MCVPHKQTMVVEPTVNTWYSIAPGVWVMVILLIASTVLLVCMLEALRRVAGWVLVGLVLAFLVYGVFGDAIPGTLQARDVPVDRQVLYLVLDSNGLLGVIPGIACTVVVAYILLVRWALEDEALSCEEMSELMIKCFIEGILAG